MEGKKGFKTSSLIGSTLIVLVSTIFVKLLSFLETMLLAGVYGATSESDAFLIAYSIPTVLFVGIGTAINTIFIPTYTKYCETGKTTERRFISNLITILGIGSIISSGLVIIFAEPIVHVFAVGFEGKQLEITIKMVRIMAFSMLPIALQNLFIGYLQLKNRFLDATIIPGVLNLVIVFFMLTVGRNNIYVLSASMVLGYLAALLLFLFSCYTEGFRYQPYLNLKEPYIKEIVLLVIPVFLSTGVSQINGIVDKTFASMLDIGYVSSLNYANKVNTIISTFSVSAFIAVLYPILARMADNESDKKFCQYVERNILFIIMLVLPMTIICLTSATEIVGLLFGHGKFKSDNVAVTAQCLKVYSIGFIGYTLRPFLIRVFYTCHDSKTPSKNTIIALIFNIVFNFLLFNRLKHIGLALATAMASNLTTIMLFIDLQKKRKNFSIKHLLVDFIKLLVAGAGMLGVNLIFEQFLKSNYAIIDLCIKGIMEITVYFIILLVLRESTTVMGITLVKKARFQK